MPRVVRSNESVPPSAQTARNLSGFNFSAPAELFPSRGKHGRAQVRYRRFSTAAEAVRFAVEDVSAAAMLGAYLEVNEARFGLQEIHALYALASYPLKRAPARQAG